MLDDKINVYDSQIMKFFYNEFLWNKSDQPDYDKFSEEVNDKLSQLFNTDKNIHSIYFYYYEYDRVYMVQEWDLQRAIRRTNENSLNNTNVGINPGVDGINWLENSLLMGQKSEFYVHFSGKLFNNMYDNEEKMVCVTRSILDPFIKQPKMSMTIRIKPDFFYRIIDDAADAELPMGLVTNDYEVVYQTGSTFSESEKVFKDANEISEKSITKVSLARDKQNVYFIYPVMNTGWHLLRSSSHERLNKPQEVAVINSFLFGFLILLVGMVIVFYVSRQITNPLEHMEDTVNKVEVNNFDVRVDVKGNDEIARLGTSFNQMIERINRLMIEEYKLVIKEKEAKLDLLQTQINPHFVYNTLQMISGFAIEHNLDELEKMVDIFSATFRYALSKTGRYSTVGEEIENVKNYLKIHQYRYQSKLSFNIDVPEYCLFVNMPALTLQPLVENSIKYSVEKETGNVKIDISAEVDNDDMVLYVKDNGIGISSKRLKEVKEKMELLADEVKTDDAGNGLANIHARFKYAYGESYGLQIESCKGSYTQVDIRFPMKREKDI